MVYCKGMGEELLNKILTEVVTIKEQQKSFVTKDDLQEVKTDIMASVDRFAKLHETPDQELVALRSKYDRLDERLGIVEKKVGLAAS